MTSARGLKGAEAERKLEHWLQRRGFHVHHFKKVHVRKKSGGFRTIGHDLFSVWDILAIRADDTHAYQVTTQAGLTARRRKIEAHSWPSSWRCYLVTHERVDDPADRRKTKEYWKMIEYRGGGWLAPRAVEVDV